MRQLISVSAAAVALALIAAGCHSAPATSPSSSNGNLQPSSSVTNLEPVAAAPAPIAPNEQAPAIDTQTPSAVTDASASSVASGSYTIKAGDTLYRIAVTHYGDGKQWRKIAAANPGLEPTKLRVGQTIVLP